MSDSGQDKEHWPLIAFIFYLMVCKGNDGTRGIHLCWDNAFQPRLAATGTETFLFSYNFSTDFPTVFQLIFKKGEYHKSHVWVFKINFLTCTQGPLAEQAPISYI